MSAEPAALIEDPAPQAVAQVAVDLPLAHLDRLFDYQVPEKLAEAAVPGCRVRVRFSGQLRDGWLVGFSEPTPGLKLSKLESVISSEPLLTPELDALFRATADHYAGVWSDVARLAIPPRHATTEKAPQREWPAPSLAAPASILPGFEAGAGLLAALQAGTGARAFWQVPPVQAGPGDLIGGVIEAANASLSGDRGVIVVLPTLRELEAALPRFKAAFGAAAVAVLGAEQGRSARYRNYLALSRGQARIVIGTRSAVFAPVKDLGLVVVVDEGNDSLRELRAPYPHARTVAMLRSIQTGCGLLLASYGRSCEVQALLERGWLHQLALTPAGTRQLTPVVRVADNTPASEATAAKLRLPSAAFKFLREHLATGPVLVQVPRAGHSGSLSCQRCRNLAGCLKCQAPLRLWERGVPSCSLCGDRPVRWECQYCHGLKFSAWQPGAVRTAEELARAFPGVLAINSSAGNIRSQVPDEPAIVVATPGAEPVAQNGYAGVLLLDTETMLARADLRVAEESVRRWCNAIALCRGPREQGTVLAVGASNHPALQALIRADISGFMGRELAERAEVGLPPAVKAVRVGGNPAALAEFMDNDPFEGVDILGPAEVVSGAEPESMVLLRVPLARGAELVRQVKQAAAIRSARKEGGWLYIQVDPEVME